MEPTGSEHEDGNRERLLLATLPHVAFEGWTQKAIAAGARDAGLSEAEAELAFPGGIDEMIEAWQDWSDRQMFAAVEASATEGLTPRARLAKAIRARIEVNAPYREAVRRTLAYLALPLNVPMAARLTWRTVDAIAYAAGDTATDFRFYSRRASLAALYSATVFYWLDDDSEEFADTWAFLERRLDDLDRARAFIPSLPFGERPFAQMFERFWRPRSG